MSKKEFIESMRRFLDKIEAGDFEFLSLPETTGYVFGNRNYGELVIDLNKITSIKVSLYTATDEERKETEDNE